MKPAAGAESPAGNADTMAEAQLVESIQFWMRAYPRRWRHARGQELVDVVVDLSGPGAQRLAPRAVFDLVRGGWATRSREHPPMYIWLLYRVFDRRIPVAYRSWALDDIDGFWYPMRRFLAGAWPVFAIPVFMSPAWGFGQMQVRSFAIAAIMVVSSMFITPQWYRSQARLRHVEPRFGEPLVEGTLVAWGVPRQRVTARSGLTWAGRVLGTTGAASVVAALLAPKVLLITRMPDHPVSAEFAVAPVGARRVVAVAILLMALGVGVLGAALARWRLDRLLGDRLDQPHRLLRPVTVSGKSGVLFSAMMMVGLTWLEVSGRIVLGLSVVLGTVAFLLLPGAIVALVVTRRADADELAGHDVWWITTRGQVPRIDQPARGLRPLPGPPPEGVLAQPPRSTD